VAETYVFVQLFLGTSSEGLYLVGFNPVFKYITMRLIVPGNTVLRMTTVWRAAFAFNAEPISSHTRLINLKSRLPLA